MKLNALLKHLPEELGVLIARRLSNLSRFAKIGHELIYIDESKKVVTFEVRQINRMTDTIYSPKEMNDFFREHLIELEQAGWKLLINPKEYEVKGLDFVTAGWVKDKMLEFGIKQTQIVEELDLDKQVVSKLMSESFGFTRWHKAAFYYYFKCMEFNNEDRKQDFGYSAFSLAAFKGLLNINTDLNAQMKLKFEEWANKRHHNIAHKLKGSDFEAIAIEFGKELINS